MPVDRVLLFDGGSLYREAGYVGLSRGRRRNELFLADRNDDFTHEPDVDRPTAPDPGTDALTTTITTWRTSRAQTSALDLSR